MKKGARLSIMEFKEGIEGKDPPETVRLSESQIKKLTAQYGFVHYHSQETGYPHILTIMILRVMNCSFRLHVRFAILPTWEDYYMGERICSIIGWST